MGIYYRMQSSKYDITPESRSYLKCRNSLHEALVCDIELADRNNHIHGVEIPENYSELSEPELIELHDEISASGFRFENVEYGISCFRDPKLLKAYYQDPEMIGMDFYDYILVFEGDDNTWGEGFDGEDTVFFVREIQRIDIEEFFSTIKETWNQKTQAWDSVED